MTEENKVYPIIELENKDKENKGNKVKSNYKINPPLKRKSF